MKPRNWCVGVGSSLLLAVTAVAGPLQQSNVMNDPAWVVHLDLDALRQTSIGKQLLVELEKPEAQRKFETFQSVFNLDPRKDLHGLTLYSATKSDVDGVALAYADFDAERLITLAQANKDYEVSAHGTNKIHSWIDDKKKSKDGEPVRTFGALYKGKTLILGQRQDRINAALDVLDGKQANLTSSKTFAQLGTGNGVFLTGGARTWELPSNDLGASVLKQAKFIWLNAQEAQEKAELKLTLETTNAETAKQLGDVCRGLVAVLALQTDKPEAVKLAKAITVDQIDAQVLAKLSLPVADLIELIKSKAGQ